MDARRTMSDNDRKHRSHRRRRKGGAGRLGLAGAVAGAVGIAAVAAGIAVLRPDGDSGDDPARPASSGRVVESAGPSVPAPKTGAVVSFRTPEGYGYRLGAVKAGTGGRPPGAAEAAPSGTTYVYADYVLTNSQQQPVLLDYPADLFLPKARVPSSAQGRCMPQPGIPDDMCTLPNTSEVTGRVGDAKPPVDENGSVMIPVGASYVVRVATDVPVDDEVSADELRLYVWNARYTSDRKGVQLAFP